MTSPYLTTVGSPLQADPGRVVARLFVPGDEPPEIQSLIRLIVERVRGLTDAQVDAELAGVRAWFEQRHHDFELTLSRHANVAETYLQRTGQSSRSRRLLVGAFLSHEYSVEGAALCNPSMVKHPDQTGVAAGQVRFIMSVRAIGEGHISSVGFRTGVAGRGTVVVDDPGRYLTMGNRASRGSGKRWMAHRLRDVGVPSATVSQILSELPETITLEVLEHARSSLRPHLLARQSIRQAMQWIEQVTASEYDLAFPAGTPLCEQVIWPGTAAESNGIEDVRLVCFAEDDGTTRYLGTYTAYDGHRIAPHLLTTSDFLTYSAGSQAGPAARNKGMAMFPRRVGGVRYALSRWGRGQISLASSVDGRIWERGPVLRQNIGSWEFVQVGNCGSPIETDAGWLVLTHGVGPMRVYRMGAILLDRDEPSRVIAEIESPLLVPDLHQRDGYVPNVVYSCGALLHDGTLTIPYGVNDTSIAFGQIELPDLIAAMVRV